jgi:quercetin dioxygenase-like cupin family protein
MFLEKVEVKNMRGGEGSVFIEKSKALPIHCKMYNRITINPNSSIGVHTHVDDEEIVYILSGKGQVLVDGIYYNIEEGSVNITKKGENHSIINNTLNPLVILAVINE